MKSIIIFDLDGTLAVSKSPLSPEMTEALASLLQKYKVAIVSGAAFHQFEKQVIFKLTEFIATHSIPSTTFHLSNLYIFPTNGSSMRVFENGEWRLVYSEALSLPERESIINAIQTSVDELGIKVEKTYGPPIEDRGDQVTFSAVGQTAPVKAKKIWDPEQKIRLPLAQKIQGKLPNFEVKIGGMTSIDITRKGIDKVHAISKIEEKLAITKENMLFIGDAIFPGGNDYAAKEAGVECIKVDGPEDTVKVIHQLLTV